MYILNVHNVTDSYLYLKILVLGKSNEPLNIHITDGISNLNKTTG